MSENGFGFMRRSLKRKIEKLLRSQAAPGRKTKLPSQLNTKDLVVALDDAVLQKLSEMAHQDDMDTGPFVLSLLNEAAHGQDSQYLVDLWQQLTRREQEVAALACQGMTNPEIAEALHISGETVKKHISSLLHKFQIRGRGVLRWMLEGWNFDNPKTPWKI
ncbi:MAG: helix-turn-helix transcriptional regulator [Anaerolineae bacterium]|mgnify:CR=1 FL=1|uniref:Helix-turn-helix transcriptional regulator n=1 Tax=Candidatus Desulfolinea nitratireducens TaxID=2841698 RepID=A0A8J6NKN8_9CHLR|nr:helix-turn-helix transcriptional regulator [Candidatus Desulfolinea nitratireducens]MBL6959774.1 helix-turn-helix transcriptional regulator [Anaerolineales bacterium]NQU31364.1 helix-turn-helix transcriptional regulator [Anaerolineae bacterium]